MHFKKSVFLFFLGSSFVFLGSMFIPQTEASVKQQGIDCLPLEAWYAVSATIGHDSPAYQVRQESGSLSAENNGEGLSMQFSAGGVTIGSVAQRLTLHPLQWGYGDEMSLLPEGSPQAVGNMVSSSRGSVSEWYVNGPLGLQQGFTVAENPQAGSGPLKIAMAIVGAKTGTVDADGAGVLLTKIDGSPLYRYSGLVVRDADGRQAEAWLEAKADMLKICVNDVGHTYPLYIDPVIQSAGLTASDGANGDSFGFSVAINGDTVVVGAYQDDIAGNLDQGSAYVFVKPSSGWAAMPQPAKLTASDGATYDNFGNSVAINGDMIVVGANYDTIGSNSDQGSAYVFVKPAAGWTTMTQTAKLTAADGATHDRFGSSVAISGDTVVVGADGKTIGAKSQQGAAYVFVKPAAGWTTMTQTAKLTASDGATTDSFGNSVAINGDMIVVGVLSKKIGSNYFQGAAYVFEKPSSGWVNMTQTARLTASDGATYDAFGHSVAINGGTVVVGAVSKTIGANSSQGAAYVFEKPSSGWATMTQTARLTASDGATYDNFGSSVAISGDTVVVGAEGKTIGANSDQGAAYAFVKPSSGWADMTQTARLPVSDGAANDCFGSSVAISGDTVVVGADGKTIGANLYQGAAYVFTISLTPGPETTTTSVVPATTTTTPNTTTMPTTTTTAPGLGFTYSILNNTVTITGYTGPAGAVVIPETIAGMPVVGIGSRAFQILPGLTSVTIPGSVTSIGDYAFLRCTGLTSVTMAEGVTRIGAHAFQDCTGLTSLIIPGSVTSIGDYAFDSCTGLTSVTMGSGVTAIGTYAFGYCRGMTSLTIGRGVKTIGNSAFYDCSGLTSVTIPAGVTNIGATAFTGCTLLTSAYFYGNAPTMGGFVFYDCAASITVYYLAVRTGFTNPWYGYPAAVFSLPDADGDGIPDASDNCPAVANTQQLDADGDGIGDLCDAAPGCGGGCGQPSCEGVDDTDNDGVPDAYDNCPTVCNMLQLDADSDGTGDVCDPTAGCGGEGQPDCERSCDTDNDRILNVHDNCPSVYNPRQSDADGDGIGDVCDAAPGCGSGCGQALCEGQTDTDGDNTADARDNCPTVCNARQFDADGDGIGDVCDLTPGCGGDGQPVCETVCTP